MGRDSGGFNTSHWIRNDIPDYLTKTPQIVQFQIKGPGVDATITI